MISIKNVKKKYKDGTNALNGISLEIQDGEFVYIVGATGSGKSTLIKLLDGEELPSSGEIMVEGVNVGKLRYSKVPKYRRLIGVVFQNYRLLPKKTVFENVSYAMEVMDAPKDKIRERVKETLKLVSLTDKKNAFPGKISGGQQQRVAIARALANRPKILIADEPTGNLDPGMSEDIITILERINREEKTTILIVTHDTEIVRNHPHRIIQLNSGHIEADIPAWEAEKRLASLFKPIPKPELDDRTVEQLVKEEIIEKRDTNEMTFSIDKSEIKEENEGN